jgi:ABC-2 type transport system permease protein
MSDRTTVPVLLTYRPWRGTLHGPTYGMWAIARSSLFLLLRRKLFWALYGVSVMVFLLFFYGQYLQSWLQTQIPDEPIRLGSGMIGATVKPKELIDIFRKVLHLDGSGYTFRNFFNYQSQITMIILALTGSILIGNDFRFGSLPFYLSKPLHRWHYLGGKFLAVGIIINLITTLPAIVLYAEYGLIDTWEYYWDAAHLLLGILMFGTILTIVLGLLLLATATWLRRTMPMIMIWTSLFVFARGLSDLLVISFRLDSRWRLIDMWNNLYLVGNWCLRMDPSTIQTPFQPKYIEAALVLAIVCVACILYLNRRIQAVEVA